MMGVKPKRVAVVWPTPDRLADISVRFERFLKGFGELGHEAFAVCLPESAEGFAGRVEICPSVERMADANFWRSLRLDAAVMITWLGYGEVLAALKQSCPWVVSVVDSDGQVGERVHVRATWTRSVFQHRTLLDKVRGGMYWLRRFLHPRLSFDAEAIRGGGFADRITVGSAAAGGHLRAFYDYHRRPDLAAKVAVVPYPVDDCFLAGPLQSRRAPQVVSIGRWGDPQKDAPLLRAAIARAASAVPDCVFMVVGSGGQEIFTPLARRYPQVRYLGVQPPGVVADLLANSRALLMSSRWEGAPVVANEALCSGCTLIGPEGIPAVASLLSEGPFGATSRGRSAARLASAVVSEMKAWDAGRRDPAAIAAYWRPRFRPDVVCSAFLTSATGH